MTLRKQILGAVVLSFVCLSSIALAATPDPARDEIDSIVDLKSHRGEVVLLDFWASWCVPCRRSFPWMDSMVRKYRKDGLRVIAVNVDEQRAAAEDFLAGTDYDIEIAYDPGAILAEAWDLEAMPSSILFDRDGNAVFRHEGFSPSKAEEYEEHLIQLLEGIASPTQSGPESSDKRSGRGVRPWEKGLMALDFMALDADAVDLAWDDHIYFSREATSGGRSFGGGGCGCN